MCGLTNGETQQVTLVEKKMMFILKDSSSNTYAMYIYIVKKLKNYEQTLRLTVMTKKKAIKIRPPILDASFKYINNINSQGERALSNDQKQKIKFHYGRRIACRNL